MSAEQPDQTEQLNVNEEDKLKEQDDDMYNTHREGNRERRKGVYLKPEEVAAHLDRLNARNDSKGMN